MAYMKDSTGRRLDSFQAISYDEADSRFTPAFVLLSEGVNSPRIRLVSETPILERADTPVQSFAWPFLVKCSDAPGQTGWDLDFSTDHATTTAQAGLNRAHLADDDITAGPFTYVEKYFNDTFSASTQCETPSRVWNSTHDVWDITYHVKPGAGITTVATQVTCLATGSADMSTITRIGVLLDAPDYSNPGALHTGYFQGPFRVGDSIYGYGLATSQDMGHNCLWQATAADARSWRQVGRFRRQPMLQRKYGKGTTDGATPGTTVGTAVELNSTKPRPPRPFMWKGQLWGMSVVGVAAAGGDVAPFRILVAPLQADLLGYAAIPVDITPDFGTWNAVDLTGLGINVVEQDSRLFTVLRFGDPEDASFLLAEVY